MSTRQIKVLPEEVINKIAAGEVIERPASIVKELLENSLDAGSTEIIIEIKNGGKKLISVTDNGKGIAAQEVGLAFQRHATSKISTFADLDTLATLGFRGEALPSIAAVAKVTLTTRTAGEISATKIQIQGGKIINLSEEGANPGTSIKVENIFYNTPARLKFLKTDNTEFSHILNNLMEQAIANFKVAFTLVNDGKQILKAPAAAKLEERLFDLFGREKQQNLLPLRLEQKFLSISGFISPPTVNTSARNQQYFFVNSRCVRHRTLNHAINAGYDTLLPKGNFPQVFIFYNISPELVDVNVHPAKREVRFSNEGAIHELTVKAIKNALSHSTIIPDLKEKTTYEIPLASNSIGAVLDFPQPQNENLFQENKSPTVTYTNRSKAPVNSISLGEIYVLGQADNAYIVATSQTGLFIIDQHAASERVMYEKLQDEYKRRAIQSQKLLIPINLELDAASKQILLNHGKLLEQLGWEVEEFGATSVLIRALPAVLEKTGNRQFILDIIRELNQLQNIKENPTSTEVNNTVLDNIIKLSACHAALRVGDEMELPEISNLVKSLTSTKVPFSCPHGRPTIIRLSKDELNKRFGRS